MACHAKILAYYEISPILFKIFSFAMQTGKLPQSFKLTKIMPPHKGGDANTTNNY